MVDQSRIGVLIVAAGRGERAGPGLPKQYRPVLGRSVLRRSLDAMKAALPRARIAAVIASDDLALYEAAVGDQGIDPPVLGGPLRQDSVLRGLEALSDNPPDFVLIHDAARPFVREATIGSLINVLLRGDLDAVAPALPIHDSLKFCDGDGRVLNSHDRSGLRRVQTPQAFLYPAILSAHRSALGGPPAGDDLAIAERAGLRVGVIDGDDMAFKITTARDFEAAEKLVLASLSDVRLGHGFDVHAFGPGNSVIICGVRIPHGFALAGHSDADVGLHALTDAILGAIGAQDIGAHFSPKDPRWRGADSSAFLQHACGLVADVNGAVAHVDITIICEAPQIAPHRDAMIERVAAIMGLERKRVSVKATTTEKLGFAGRREGIAALATATIRLPG